MNSGEFRCGTVAIVGRPNVGKSTILNTLLGQKISITSPKPQTTRHRITGIVTDDAAQLIFIDTPGMHTAGGKAINRYMDRTAGSALQDVDIIVMVVDCQRWTAEDDYVLRRVAQAGRPVVLAVNKVDTVKNKEELLPVLQEYAAKMPFAAVLPISAYTSTNMADLRRTLTGMLPLSPPHYPPEQFTDRSERFLAAEIIREKLMRNLGKELPYSLTVEIENFAEDGALRRIHAIIWVERAGQKKIVIGSKGEGIKEIGRQARVDMENLFGGKVYLEMWVKVREGWSDNERALRSLGYDEF